MQTPPLTFFVGHEQLSLFEVVFLVQITIPPILSKTILLKTFRRTQVGVVHHASAW